MLPRYGDIILEEEEPFRGSFRFFRPFRDLCVLLGGCTLSGVCGFPLINSLPPLLSSGNCGGLPGSPLINLLLISVLATDILAAISVLFLLLLAGDLDLRPLSSLFDFDKPW